MATDRSAPVPSDGENGDHEDESHRASRAQAGGACGLLCASHTVRPKGCLDTCGLTCQAARRFRPPPPPLVMKSRGGTLTVLLAPTEKGPARRSRFAPLALTGVGNSSSVVRAQAQARNLL